jgi:hypothetical protein
VDVLADLHAEKCRRGLGVRLETQRNPKQNQVRKTEYKNIWYLVFFWLLFFKVAGVVEILKFWWWVRYG